MASKLAQKLYWKSPYFVKCWLASFNARQMDKCRHGEGFERALMQIAERDKWSMEKLYDYQQERVQSVIQRAAKNVPYYRKVFSDCGIDPYEIKTVDDLKDLPILEKNTVREIPLQLVDETLNSKNLIKGSTSGSTGTPVTIYRTVEDNEMVFAYMEERCHKLAGIKRRENRSVSIGVYLVTDLKRTSPPFWVYNRHWDQLYLSGYHLSPQNLDTYIRKLREFKADYFEGYPSCLYTIAQYINDNKLAPVPFKACITAAENLYDYQRQAMEKAFACKVYEQYGCSEQTAFAAECEEGSLHISPELGVIEIVDDDDNPVPIGQTGQMICTGLNNQAQPFIRYRVGDMGALKVGKCKCGRELPLLSHLEGRTDDVLITRSGKQVGRLDTVFKDTPGIAAAQIVQDDWGKFRIRIIPGNDYSEADGKKAKKNLYERLGEGDIAIELVDEITRSASGKFKALICKVNKSDITTA